MNKNLNELRAVVEYNDFGYLIYTENYVGAYVRAKTEEEALKKFDSEINRYLSWVYGKKEEEKSYTVKIVQKKKSALDIADADSDVLFDSEKAPFTQGEYAYLKNLALKSAADFQTLYDSVSDKDASVSAPRKTFYGSVPITAREMYTHTKNVNSYYFGEIGIRASNEPDIFSCRKEGFEKAERELNFLNNPIFNGNYGEDWTLRKVLRRFIWHDRIHAKAMYKTAVELQGENKTENPFYFDVKINSKVNRWKKSGINL